MNINRLKLMTIKFLSNYTYIFLNFILILWLHFQSIWLYINNTTLKVNKTTFVFLEWLKNFGIIITLISYRFDVNSSVVKQCNVT